MTLSICLAWWHTLASVSFHCVLNYRQFLFISSVFISVCLHSPLVTELHFQRRIPMRLQQFHIYSGFDQSVHLLRERWCQYCLFLVAAEWSCLTWEIDSTKKSKKERGRESKSRPEFHFHLKSFTFFFSLLKASIWFTWCVSVILLVVAPFMTDYITSILLPSRKWGFAQLWWGWKWHLV